MHQPLDHKQLGSAMPRWEEGVYVGLRKHTVEKLVATTNGVCEARSIKRRIESERWDAERISKISGTPWKPYLYSEDDQLLSRAPAPAVVDDEEVNEQRGGGFGDQQPQQQAMWVPGLDDPPDELLMGITNMGHVMALSGMLDGYSAETAGYPGPFANSFLRCTGFTLDTLVEVLVTNDLAMVHAEINGFNLYEADDTTRPMTMAEKGRCKLVDRYARLARGLLKRDSQVQAEQQERARLQQEVDSLRHTLDNLPARAGLGSPQTPAGLGGQNNQVPEPPAQTTATADDRVSLKEIVSETSDTTAKLFTSEAFTACYKRWQDHYGKRHRRPAVDKDPAEEQLTCLRHLGEHSGTVR